MKFKINYKVGSDIRDKNIFAENLEEAEKIANIKFRKWTDIIILTGRN
jgi:hypothetical protein